MTLKEQLENKFDLCIENNCYYLINFNFLSEEDTYTNCLSVVSWKEFEELCKKFETLNVVELEYWPDKFESLEYSDFKSYMLKPHSMIELESDLVEKFKNMNLNCCDIYWCVNYQYEDLDEYDLAEEEDDY